jgi:hypothetical protein
MADNDNNAEKKIRDTTVKESRDDSSPLFTGDWLKKSRDDIPASNKPLPKNPLLNIGPTPEPENSEGKPASDKKD